MSHMNEGWTVTESGDFWHRMSRIENERIRTSTVVAFLITLALFSPTWPSSDARATLSVGERGDIRFLRDE